MSATDELADADVIAHTRRQFGLEGAPIDTAARRLEAWALVCTGGAMNVLRIGDVSWSWSTQPRLQKNGAAIGRVYAQRPDEFARDAGMYKIDAGGRVLTLPAELRAVLPGGLGVETSVDAEQPEGAP